jgi:phage virion morphogenesis protein
MNEWLKQQFSFLKPATRKRAMREISNYLLKRNRQRVSQQKNADGTAYAPRKPRFKILKNGKSKRFIPKRKMLLGFKRHIRAKSTPDKAEVGIYGHAARLATIHDHGASENGIKYPSRELVQFEPDDVPAIESILQRYLSAQA